MKSELQRFYELADDIEIAMMTTRRPDGHMRSRAMANQTRASGADLWFVTSEGSDKLVVINVARDAGVKVLVLSHLVPPDDPEITEQMWIDAARQHFRGEIFVGRDLLEV